MHGHTADWYSRVLIQSRYMASSHIASSSLTRSKTCHCTFSRSECLSHGASHPTSAFLCIVSASICIFLICLFDCHALPTSVLLHCGWIPEINDSGGSNLRCISQMILLSLLSSESFHNAFLNIQSLTHILWEICLIYSQQQEVALFLVFWTSL